jgi:hypothetical protein
VVAELVDRPLAEVDLLAVHLEVEDLRQRAETGAEEGQAFLPEVAEALGDVLRCGPGLTLDHPDVETLLERERRARAEPLPEQVQAVHDGLSVVTAGDEAAIGDTLRGMEARIMAEVSRATRDAVQQALHRNMVHRIGMMAAAGAFSFGIGVASGMTANFRGEAILNFAVTHWAILTEVAATYGSPFAAWFHAVMMQVPDVRAVMARMRDRGRGEG